MNNGTQCLLVIVFAFIAMFLMMFLVYLSYLIKKEILKRNTYRIGNLVGLYFEEVIKTKHFIKTPIFSFKKVHNCHNNCNEECVLFDKTSGKKNTLFMLRFPELDKYLLTIKPFKLGFLNEKLRSELRIKLLKHLHIEEYYCEYSSID